MTIYTHTRLDDQTGGVHSFGACVLRADQLSEEMARALARLPRSQVRAVRRKTLLLMRAGGRKNRTVSSQVWGMPL